MAGVPLCIAIAILNLANPPNSIPAAVFSAVAALALASICLLCGRLVYIDLVDDTLRIKGWFKIRYFDLSRLVEVKLPSWHSPWHTFKVKTGDGLKYFRTILKKGPLSYESKKEKVTQETSDLFCLKTVKRSQVH